MEGKRRGGTLSRFLYGVGKAVRFAPDSSFAPPRSEKPAKQKNSFLLPYRQQFQNAMAKMREQSFFLNGLSAFYRNLFSTRVRSFGLLFFTGGFLQILFYFLGNRISFFTAGEETLLFGVCEIFIAVLCAFARGDLENSLKKSFLFGSVIRPLFGVEPWRIPTGKKHDSTYPMIFSGVVLALFSTLFSPTKVLLFLLLSALTLFVFYLPEAGLYVMGLLFFLIPSSLLTALILLTLVSFFCKCAIGKRSISFSATQAALFSVLILLFLVGTTTFSLAFQFLSLYFLISCLIRTTVSLRRLLFCFVLGALFCAGRIFLFELLRHSVFLSVFRGLDLKGLLFDFDSLSMGVFLVLMIPVSAGLFRSLRWGGRIVLFPLLFLVVGGALYFIGSSVLWNAFFLSLILFGFFTYRSFLITLLVLGLTFLTTLNLFPATVGEKVFSFFAGTGQGTFETGLFFSLYEKFGIFFFLVTVAVLSLFFYRVYRFKKDTTRPEVYPLVLSAMVSLVAFIYLGFCPIPVTTHIFMLFVCLLTLPEVSYACAVREEIRLPY